MITAEREMSFIELDRRTDQIAAGLIRLGLQRLDPVIFQLTNRLETVLAWYGCVKAGLIPVATLAAHRMHEIGNISRKVGAVAHIVEASLPTFDLVGFAREHAADHPTIRHILTVAGAPTAPNRDSRNWGWTSRSRRRERSSSRPRHRPTHSTSRRSNFPAAPPGSPRSFHAFTPNTGTTPCSTRGDSVGTNAVVWHI